MTVKILDKELFKMYQNAMAESISDWKRIAKFAKFIDKYADDETIDLYFTDATWEAYKNEEEETRTGKLNFVKIEDTWYLDTETSPNFMYLFLGAAE